MRETGIPVHAATTRAMSSSATSVCNRRGLESFSCSAFSAPVSFFCNSGNLAVLNLRREIEVPAPLRLLKLEFRLFELAVDDTDRIDSGFLVLPLRLQRMRALLQVRELAFEFFQPFARALVLLLLERALFDFQLQDLPFKLVDLRRHRVEFHSQPRRRLINQVDGLVRKKAVGDVSVRQSCGSHEGGVLDAHSVMNLT